MIFVWLLLSVLFFGFGEYLSGRFITGPSWWLALMIMAVYALGSAAWLPAIALGKSISVTGTCWNVLSMVVTLVVGLAIFQETPTILKMVGIFLALVAVVLMSL